MYDERNRPYEIQHVIVSLIDSGLSIFYQNFAPKELDPDLFSALLTAISLVRKNEVRDTPPPEFEVFEVGDWIATVCYGEYLAGIMLSNGPIAPRLADKVKRFISMFEDEYGFILGSWGGDRTFFDQEWASQHLMECLQSQDGAYAVSEHAMQLTSNGLQVRLLLLIKKIAGEGRFEIEDVRRAMVESLDVSEKTADVYISELKKLGIISSSAGV